MAIRTTKFSKSVKNNYIAKNCVVYDYNDFEVSKYIGKYSNIPDISAERALPIIYHCCHISKSNVI